ncbi:hypothetical protein FPQ18DRAFT_408583 [Pyronema domesticum]|nr:hypothetical protein FPQ18DRAFT_408583 [Pyronema domesticum]
MPHRDHATFIKQFFATSDTPTAHAEYVENFTQDATLKMGLRTAEGKEQIRTVREGMWAAVSSRHHVVTQTYPSSSSEEDAVMMFGYVDYTLKNGKSLSTEWASRMVFDESGEKMKFYQVWLDASPMIVAMGKKIQAGAQGGMEIVEQE